MFSIKLVGNINNVGIALDSLRAFASEAEESQDHQTSDEMESLFSQLPKNPNRNVFLWLMELTLEIVAPVFWWKQLGQYSVDVFNLRYHDHLQEGERLLSGKNFEGFISKEKLSILNNYIRDGHPDVALKPLPTNFIQRGYVKINYKCLNEIYCSENQASDEHWASFLRFTETLPYQELITRCEQL
jgi:hypothetical protein